MWVTILLYVVMIYMAFSIFKNSKSQKKRQQLVDSVNAIKDKDDFFEKIDAAIASYQDDPEYLNKAQVLKLWGMAYHSDYDSFTEQLEKIDLHALTSMKKDKVVMNNNEDSFFYMYLGIPNLLYRDERMDLLDAMIEKMQPMQDALQDQLVCAISVEINKFYKKEGDLGLAFYEKLLNGDYAEYTYAKSMIGLYKSIANATAARIYLDTNETEKYQSTESLLKDFDLSGVGHRWLETLNIELPGSQKEEETPEITTEEEPEQEEDQETFRFTKDSVKNADIIDAEVTNEKEEDEEKKEDQE